jgi:hypothetical protein
MCCLLVRWQGRITREGDAGKAWIVDSRGQARKSRQIAERGKVKDAADTYHVYAKTKMWGDE